jgi:tetratricopeptide (TPR) repeat protein
MIRIFLISFILYITAESTFAQFEDSIVSIHSQIKIESDSNKIADLYLKLAQLHRTNNLKLTKEYSLKCLDISERNGYSLGIAKAKLEMVDLFEFLKPEYSYDLALDAYVIFIKEKDSLFMLRSLNSLANVVYIQEDYDKAVEIYNKALNYAIQMNDTAIIPALLNNIGTCIANKQDFEKAKQFFIKAINSIKTDNSDFETIIYINLGEINTSLKNYDSVQIIYDKVEKLCLLNNNKKALVPLYNNYSNYYNEINKFDSAEIYARKALFYSKQLHLINYEHTAYENLITVFKEKNILDSVVYYYELDNILKDSISKIDKLRSIDLLTIKSDKNASISSFPISFGCLR